MATDAEIRAAGFYAIPDRQYLQNEFQLPTNTPVEEETESFGIPQTQAFTNSGGNNYTGGYNFGNKGFQQAVDARQRNLNKPTDTSTFMGRTIGKVKDFIEPQSANDIRTSGYQEPRFQPGIIGMMMGKLDNYRNLPRADQAFISQNMGYTGPTIFGENNSGLGKDPFGINTRSAFGNYAQHSRDMAAEDGDLAETVADQIARGLTNTLQMRQLAFHREKQKTETTRIAEKKAADLKAFEDQKTRSGITSGANDGRYENINDRNRGGQGAFKEDTTSMKSAGRSYQDAKGNVGYSRGRKDGGRIGYFFGGRVNYKAGGRIGFAGGGKDAGKDSDFGSEDFGGDKEDTREQYGAVGQYNTGPTSTKNNDDGPKTFFNDPKTLYDSTILGNFPTGLTTTTPYGRLSAILDLNKTLEEEDVEGKVQFDSSIGPVNTTTAFDTDIGPTFNASYNQGPVSIGYNNLDGINASYNDGPISVGYNDGQATVNYSKSFAKGGRVNFKNGGLASIL